MQPSLPQVAIYFKQFSVLLSFTNILYHYVLQLCYCLYQPYRTHTVVLMLAARSLPISCFLGFFVVCLIIKHKYTDK